MMRQEVPTNRFFRVQYIIIQALLNQKSMKKKIIATDEKNIPSL